MNIIILLHRRCKQYFLALLLILTQLDGYSQSCSCPPTNECGACQGGLSNLTLRFNGLGGVVTATDQGGLLVTLIISQGDVFTLNGRGPGGRFQGSQVILAVNILGMTAIKVDCTAPVYVNATFGSFTVIATESVDGGPVCCAPGDIEKILPVINCRADITIALSSSECSRAVEWALPTVTDNCNDVVLTSNYEPGDVFLRGTTKVVYTATDKFNNTSSCSFNITVFDNTKPVISNCLSNYTVSANTSCKAKVNWPPPMASDNCKVKTFTSTYDPGYEFPIGTTKVTYTAEDESGNISTCVFNVVVNDDSSPVITKCPSDIIVSANTSCKAKVNWIPPIASDNCKVKTFTSTHQPDEEFPIGITKVTYTGKDESGNISSCSFNVIVHDDSNQTCPSDIIVSANDLCQANVSWEAPTFKVCGKVTIESSHNSGDLFPIGSTEVIYTATDKNGNISTCQFMVVVKDENIPVISACPNDINVEGNELGLARAEWLVPTATNICSDVILTSSHQPGANFPEGKTEVEYKATDQSGNAVYCRFNVNVKTTIEIDATNVVTPDGDGINDAWTVTNLEKYINNKVVVIDRWGSIIYTASNYNNGSIAWRGENRNGVMVPTGTYFYTVSVRHGSSVLERSGFIELIR